MIVALFIALGIAYIAEQPSAPPGSNSTAINDPIVGAIPPSGQFGIDQLYSRLRTERRDPNWAPQAERQLRDYLGSIRYIGVPNNPLRVMCGSSLCEAAGVIDAPSSKDDSSPKSPLNRSMLALQGKDIHDFASRSGLDYVSSLFGPGPAKKKVTTFLIYFQRKH